MRKRGSWPWWFWPGWRAEAPKVSPESWGAAAVKGTFPSVRGLERLQRTPGHRRSEPGSACTMARPFQKVSGPTAHLGLVPSQLARGLVRASDTQPSLEPLMSCHTFYAFHLGGLGSGH